MNTNEVLFWFKEFKYSWLPQTIPDNPHLLGLITNKLRELEQLLIQNNQNETELSIVHDHPCDTEQPVLPAQQGPERSLPTPPDLHNHIDDEVEKPENLCRPAIRLKRISLAEAERFIPAVWKPTKSKRGRKKGQKKLSNGKKNPETNKELLSSPQDETTNNIRKSTRTKKANQNQSKSSLKSIQSTNDDKKKGKRKLRAIDAEDDDLFTLGNLSQTNHANGDTDCEQISRYIGQNGILSQTRKINETTTTDDDFTIQLQSRKSKRGETLTTILSEHPNDINTITESSIVEPMNIFEDGGSVDEEQIFQEISGNNDDSLFTSLDITRDKTIETSSTLNNNSIINYNDCIEDISNDGIDPPPSPKLGHFPLTT